VITEADTCRKYVLPKLYEAGWTDDQISEQKYFPDDLERTLDLLTRRELIEPTDEGYRFQVELIRRWFTRSRIDSQNI
jgi:hypothetical protein